VAMATAAAEVVLTPSTFYHFRSQKFTLHPQSFTFETFSKKCAKTKIVARFNVKKTKRLEIACDDAATFFFYQNLSISAKVGNFWPLLRLC
jgi:hypothetical protein